MGSIARRTLLSGGVLTLGVLGLRTAGAQGAGTWVITAPEASMPQSPTSKAGRSISRGPAIRQVSPEGAVAANKPFNLRIEFAGRGGEKIAPGTAQVVLLRGSNIDITQRVKAYITPTGIVIPDAMVAPGTHVLQVAVSDDRGHQSTANIEIDAK